MDDPAISFVIPVRNDAARLKRCLRSIARSAASNVPVEVIVADNGSTDDSTDVARADGAVVLELPGARLGELRNRGASAARGRVLAFVDADHEIVHGWIAAALDVLADERVGGVGAPCQPPSPATWVQDMYNRLRPHENGRTIVEWLGSGNLAMRRTDFDAVGGFDPALETCEDVDLCRKIRARGLVLASDSRLGNIHYGDPRTLGEVFLGELWRGRDNVRVSLRAPRSGRSLASAAVPVVNLAAAVLVVAGLATTPWSGFGLMSPALAYLTAIVTARGFMLRGRLGDLPKAIAVAAAYEAGRSLALTGRFGHAHRRAVATARSTT